VSVPCDCCAVASPPRCGIGEVPFSSVLVSANPAGLTITNLASTIDGTQGADLSGFSPPVTEAVLVANPTTAIDYLFASPVDNLVRLRWHNGGGGVLTDQDGFGLITVTFLDAGLATIATMPWDLTAPIGNNAPARQLDFTALNGVARVRFSGFHKQNPAVMGTGSPLLRQVEAFTSGPLFPCRRRNGTLEWYDELGNLVPLAEVGSCSPQVPLLVPLLTMTEAALGDDPGLGERMCNVVPAVTSFSGYTALAGPCYDGSAANGDTLNWSGPVSSVSMSYESGGSAGAGAALVAFSAPSIGTVTGPANGVKMLAGEVRRSNPLIGGGYATITYLAPAGAPANGAPSQDGGPNIRLGPAAIQAFTPYHFRIDFWEP
jgi:hypothetical protein